MLNQTNVVPTTYASTPVTMPIQSAVQPNTQLLSLQPVSTPMIPAQPVATKTSVIPDYGTTQITQVPLASTVPVQTSVPMVNTVGGQPTTVISTQPQTKYRLWNMLVPVFKPEPQPIPQPAPQPVTIPEPVPVPEPVEIPQTYEVPAEPVYTPTYEEPVYEEPATTYSVPEYVETTPTYTTTSPNVRVIRRGNGITMNEQQNIIK